jgi:hypothetical protein
MSIPANAHAFVVRIWWEPGLTQSDGRPLWRGQIQHAISSQSHAFQSLNELLQLIQAQTGDLEGQASETGMVPGEA